METCQDNQRLVESSSDGSFELVDPNFDDSYYNELRGVATADYIPMEKGEVLLRKGDSVVISEQTLDQLSYIIRNKRSGSQGKVPIEYIRFVADETTMEDTGEMVHIRPTDLRVNGNRHSGSHANRKLTYYEDDDPGSDLDQGKTRSHGDERHYSNGVDATPSSRLLTNDDDDTESDLDQGGSRVTPGKKSGKMGIMRRKGVSKTKGSPYRSSGSSHEDDAASPLASSSHLVGGVSHMQRRNDISRPVTTPPSSHLSISMALATTPTSSDPSRDSLSRSHPSIVGEGGTRGQAVAMPTDVKPEFKHIEKYNIVSVSGADRDGRPVIVFSACRLPASYLINHQMLFNYILFTLDHYVEQDYTVVYFHHGFSSTNKYSVTFLKQFYYELDRKYKKNLKKLYIVHPTNFIRMMMILFKPIISYKFGRKVSYINRLEELKEVLFLEQVDVPDKVKEYDAQLAPPPRPAQSRSVFHISSSTDLHAASKQSPHKQYGVPLADLVARDGVKIPRVVQCCVEHLEVNGLEVMGIFRRAPNNVRVHALKKQVDQGEDIDFEEHPDPHLSAVLIKMFLRELPEPLLTFPAYSQVMTLRSLRDEAERLQMCSKVVRDLPQANYDLLKYLISFLNKVRAHEEVNKMSSLNLAIVFGPNLIWSTDEAASLVGLGEINSFTMLLIENYNLLFTL